MNIPSKSLRSSILVFVTLLLWVDPLTAREFLLYLTEPPKTISIEEAIKKVEPLAKAEKLEGPIAVVFDKPTASRDSAGNTTYFYKQPIYGYELNGGLMGKPDEWSWFLTYIIYVRRWPPPDHVPTWFRTLETYQLKANGEINGLGNYTQ